jgi:hypothetical protein
MMKSQSLFLWTGVVIACLSDPSVQVHGLAADLQKPVSQLLQQYSSNINDLKAETYKVVGSANADAEPYKNNVFYLRYCLDKEDPSEQLAKLKENLQWRQGAGKPIVDAACQAVEQATASGGWNNKPVLDAAPNSALISKFLTPVNAISTTSSNNDLVYCIRAGQIDDVGLMEAVSVEELVDFFLYVKEVNAIVCNQRSVETDKLWQIVTVNDLKGVKLIGGSSTFRKALSDSSKQSNNFYPATAGTTLLLNLPPLLSALVKLFTPLFPAEVQKRLKFAQGPLKDVETLTEITPGGSKRDQFLKQLDDLIYSS